MIVIITKITMIDYHYSIFIIFRILCPHRNGSISSYYHIFIINDSFEDLKWQYDSLYIYLANLWKKYVYTIINNEHMIIRRNRAVAMRAKYSKNNENWIVIIDHSNLVIITIIYYLIIIILISKMAKTPAVGKKAAKTPKKVLYYSISIQYYLNLYFNNNIIIFLLMLIIILLFN